MTESNVLKTVIWFGAFTPRTSSDLEKFLWASKEEGLTPDAVTKCLHKRLIPTYGYTPALLRSGTYTLAEALEHRGKGHEVNDPRSLFPDVWNEADKQGRFFRLIDPDEDE